jgi:spore coat protein U-like protein
MQHGLTLSLKNGAVSGSSVKRRMMRAMNRAETIAVYEEIGLRALAAEES